MKNQHFQSGRDKSQQRTPPRQDRESLIWGGLHPEIVARLAIVLPNRLDEERRIRGILASLIRYGYDQDLVELLDMEIQKHLLPPTLNRDPFFPYPSESDNLDGSIRFARVYQNQLPLGLFQDELSRHMAVFGSSGSGKTVFLMNLIVQFIRNGIKCHFFDFTGGELHALVSQLDRDALIIHASEDRDNAMQPAPGVNPDSHMNLFANAFCQASGLLEASTTFIQEALIDCYKLYGVSDGSGRYPCVGDFLEVIKRMKTPPYGRAANYKQSCENRVTGLWINLKPQLDCSQGYDLFELSRRTVIWDLSDLAHEWQNFFVIMKLLKFFSGRMAVVRGDGTESLSYERLNPLVIMIDEATRLFDMRLERKWNLGSPMIASHLAQDRKVKLALVAAMQQPSQALSTLLSETNTKILFRLEDARDLNIVADSMALSSAQREAAYNLPVGHALVRMNRHDAPILVQTPPPVPLDQADPQLTRQKTRQFLSNLSYTPRIFYDQVIRQTFESRPTADKYHYDLDEDERRFLMEVVNHLYLTTSEYYQRTGLSNYRGNRAKKVLTEQAYLKIHGYQTGLPGGSRQILEPTPKAYETLKVQPPSRGKGGFLHQYLQKQVKEAVWPQYRATIEKDSFDVLYESDADKVAIEVVTPPCTATQKRNLERFLGREDIRRLIFLCSDRTVEKSLKKNLEKTDDLRTLPQVTFSLLGLLPALRGE